LIITTANFIEANNFNVSTFNIDTPLVIEEEEEEEEEEETQEIQTQASTSSAVLTKKRGRGRPADSPGTKIRKAADKSNKNKKSKNY